MVYAMNITSVCQLQLTKLNNVSSLWSLFSVYNVELNLFALVKNLETVHLKC